MRLVAEKPSRCTVATSDLWYKIKMEKYKNKDRCALLIILAPIINLRKRTCVDIFYNGVSVTYNILLNKNITRLSRFIASMQVTVLNPVYIFINKIPPKVLK